MSDNMNVLTPQGQLIVHPPLLSIWGVTNTQHLGSVHISENSEEGVRKKFPITSVFTLTYMDVKSELYILTGMRTQHIQREKDVLVALIKKVEFETGRYIKGKTETIPLESSYPLAVIYDLSTLYRFADIWETAPLKR